MKLTKTMQQASSIVQLELTQNQSQVEEKISKALEELKKNGYSHTERYITNNYKALSESSSGELANLGRKHAGNVPSSASSRRAWSSCASTIAHNSDPVMDVTLSRICIRSLLYVSITKIV